MAQFTFNAQDHAPDAGMTGPIKAGWHIFNIDESSIEPTANGDGAYIKVRLNVAEGDFAGQKCWHMFNIKHENEKTVEIAQAQLSALCHAVGVLNMTDTNQLHGINFKARVKIENKEGYAPQNRVTAWRAVDYETGEEIAKADAAAPTSSVPNFSAPQTAATAPQTTQPQAAASVGGMPTQPWQNPQQAATAPTATTTAQPAAPQPAAPAKPAAPVAETAPEFRMTELAGAFTREQYHDSGWTDEKLVEAGMMEIIMAEAPAAAPQAPLAPQAAPTAPAASATTPPWVKTA